jgi:hypothetical protein
MTPHLLKRLLKLTLDHKLKPIDLAILIQLSLEPNTFFTYNDLNHNLGIPIPTLVRHLAHLYELSLIYFHQGSVGGTPQPHRFQIRA